MRNIFDQNVKPICSISGARKKVSMTIHETRTQLICELLLMSFNDKIQHSDA